MEKLIFENYEIKIQNKVLIDSHFGTEVYLFETNKGKFIIKMLPLYIDENIDNEGYITEYLYNNGISVARLLKTKNGSYHVKTEQMQFHVQEFIEGETFIVNTAPEWFLQESASMLGKIHNTLKDYNGLNTKFGKDFFNETNVTRTKQYYTEQLNNAINDNDTSLIIPLKERQKHLERISAFNIDVNKLTYSNSHGDYHIGQIITDSNKLTVIDWTSANKMPICLEIIVSYVTESPVCMDGKIDTIGLKKYIGHYLKSFSLNNYGVRLPIA